MFCCWLCMNINPQVWTVSMCCNLFFIFITCNVWRICLLKVVNNTRLCVILYLFEKGPIVSIYSLGINKKIKLFFNWFVFYTWFKFQCPSSSKPSFRRIPRDFEHLCPKLFPWVRNVSLIAQYWFVPGTDSRVTLLEELLHNQTKLKYILTYAIFRGHALFNECKENKVS